MLQPGGNETDPEVTSCHSDDGLRRRRLDDFNWAEAIVLAQRDDMVVEPWADLAREKYESLSREVAKGQLGDMCEWVVLEHDDVEGRGEDGCAEERRIIERRMHEADQCRYAVALLPAPLSSCSVH